MKISEFGDLCGLLLGKWAEYIATLFSVLAILGAAIVYWVLMSNFLFSTVSFVHGKHIWNNHKQSFLISISDHVVDSNTTHQDGVYCPKNETPQSFGNTLDTKISQTLQSEYFQIVISHPQTHPAQDLIKSGVSSLQSPCFWLYWSSP